MKRDIAVTIPATQSPLMQKTVNPSKILATRLRRNMSGVNSKLILGDCLIYAFISSAMKSIEYAHRKHWKPALWWLKWACFRTKIYRKPAKDFRMS